MVGCMNANQWFFLLVLKKYQTTGNNNNNHNCIRTSLVIIAVQQFTHLSNYQNRAISLVIYECELTGEILKLKNLECWK